MKVEALASLVLAIETLIRHPDYYKPGPENLFRRNDVEEALKPVKDALLELGNLPADAELVPRLYDLAIQGTADVKRYGDKIDLTIELRDRGGAIGASMNEASHRAMIAKLALAHGRTVEETERAVADLKKVYGAAFPTGAALDRALRKQAQDAYDEATKREQADPKPDVELFGDVGDLPAAADRIRGKKITLITLDEVDEYPPLPEAMLKPSTLAETNKTSPELQRYREGKKDL